MKPTYGSAMSARIHASVATGRSLLEQDPRREDHDVHQLRDREDRDEHGASRVMEKPSMRTLVWFRGKDLRLADHAPLHDAIRHGEVVPIFVVDPYFFAPERAREMPNRMQFLVDSLAELAASIEARGSRLLFAHGKSVEVVPELARAFAADRVVAHRWSEPFGIERDRRVAKALAEGGSRLELFEGETLAAPGQVLTGSGTPFSVFTPFSRAFVKAVTIGAPRPTPKTLPPLPPIPAAAKKLLGKLPTLASIGVTRNEQVVAGGEQAARARARARS